MIKITIYIHDGEEGVHGEGVTLAHAIDQAVAKIRAADPEIALTEHPHDLKAFRRWARLELDGAMVLISEPRDVG